MIKLLPIVRVGFLLEVVPLKWVKTFLLQNEMYIEIH